MPSIRSRSACGSAWCRTLLVALRKARLPRQDPFSTYRSRGWLHYTPHPVTGHIFHPTLLREYDIRGTVGETLHAADAHALGRAFGTVIVREGRGGKRVCVGFDGRVSSPALERALVAGLLETGIDVLRVGRGPSPLLYYSVHHLNADAGIMVTGSHNPKDQNGFKLMLGKGSFHGADIARLGTLAATGDFANGSGHTEAVQVSERYLDELLKAFRPPRPAPIPAAVAWDPGNGAAGELVVALTRRLPGRHVLINETIDGDFPAHHPDPTEEKNLTQLRDLVRRERCDLGIAFDGDGDRIGVVDDQGRVVWADMLLALLAREVLRDHPGATIIADVKSSQVLYDEIARLGGRPLMWRTGHALIKTKLAETKAPLAGELSGHFFFADRYFGFDDALYAAVRLLNLLANSGQSLGQLSDTLPRIFNTPELRLYCAEDRKFAVVDEMRRHLRAAGAKVIDIDGVRVTTPDGWWLVRASNTQAALIARAEARDEQGLDRVRAALENELARCGVRQTR